MVTFEQLKNRQEKICVVGLGYVGLPLAVLLSKQFDVVGFDISIRRISELEAGTDRTKEVGDGELGSSGVVFSSDAKIINECKFIIVAVPTPVDKNNTPDMSIVKSATKIVAENISDGSVVVYESTVYPGATEEDCVPILESVSGLVVGRDISVGYSPERVNPGDKEHTIDKVVKIVSGFDEATLEVVAGLYGSLTTVHRAPSIRVAEAAKVIENAQRDINIAFVNELAIIFHKMGISVYDVLEAAGTKWNFLRFTPGFVGGHCIGVDPYYLTYKAQEVGHTPEVILAGRGINDSMHKFVAHRIIKRMLQMGRDVSSSKFTVLGITFKENVPDIRNSKVAELYLELSDFGLTSQVADSHADAEEVKHEYGIELRNREDLEKADTLIVAVSHDEYRTLSIDELVALTNGPGSLVVDIKRMYNQKEVEYRGLEYWTL